MSPEPTVFLVNPLPRALAHYQAAVLQTLDRIGVCAAVIDTPSSELTGLSKTEKLRRLVTLMQSRWRLRRDSRELLILWPAFGYGDALIWATKRTRRTLVIHDPIPLRPTLASGPFSARVSARLTKRSSTQILAHTDAASSDLQAFGWNAPFVAAHPYLMSSVSRSPSRRRIVVAGQFKSARDTHLLERLGPLLREAGFEPRIVGRGWPEEIPGWAVNARFLSESELDQELSDAEVVLLPYTRVYQSGIAIRSAEMNTPVVGPADSNIPEIFGKDWCGLVTAGSADSAWLAAITEASQNAGPEIENRLAIWRLNVDEQWRGLSRARGWL